MRNSSVLVSYSSQKIQANAPCMVFLKLDFYQGGSPHPTLPRGKAGCPAKKTTLPHPAEIKKTCGAQWGKADCVSRLRFPYFLFIENLGGPSKIKEK